MNRKDVMIFIIVINAIILLAVFISFTQPIMDTLGELLEASRNPAVIMGLALWLVSNFIIIIGFFGRETKRYSNSQN